MKALGLVGRLAGRLWAGSRNRLNKRKIRISVAEVTQTRSKLALVFDDAGQTKWRRWLAPTGYKRVSICLQADNCPDWVVFTPDAKRGVKITVSKTRPHFSVGDFIGQHELAVSDDVKIARLFLGLNWWQGPWALRGLRKLLNARKSGGAVPGQASTSSHGLAPVPMPHSRPEIDA